MISTDSCKSWGKPTWERDLAPKPRLLPSYINDGRLFFHAHSLNANVIVLGGYTGQGVVLSVHLGRWAAESLLGRRDVPGWGLASGKG